MSDPAELEREAEAARARLAETADQLRARMSPGQMMDEVLNQFRNGDGSQMLSNLRTQARDNPMALALVGSGLAWLMMGSGAQAQDHTASATSTGYSPRPSHGATFPVVGADPAERFSSTSPEYPPTTQEADDSGRGIMQGASDALASAGEAVGSRLHAVGDRASHLTGDLHAAGGAALGSARQTAAQVGQQARYGFLDVLEREPLVIGALGVAVGAAIGALLPATEVERQHLGPAGEQIKDKAGALVDRGVAMAKEAASEVYATAREEADRQGLVPGDKPIAEKIDAVVRAAGEAAGSVVEQHKPDDRSEPNQPFGDANRI